MTIAEDHGLYCEISWLLLTNLMILIVAFRWSKITFFLHLLMGATIAFLTVYFSYTYIKNFLPVARVAVKPKRQFMYNHKMIGLVLVFGCLFK
jgi:hypothetical protein